MISLIYSKIFKTGHLRTASSPESMALQLGCWISLGSWIESQWMAPRSTEHFLLLKSIKRVPRTPRGLLFKSKLSSRIGSADLGHLDLLHKKEQ